VFLVKTVALPQAWLVLGLESGNNLQPDKHSQHVTSYPSQLSLATHAL